MKEINFYCIEEEVNSFLFSFLLRLTKSNKKVVIYSENMDKIEKLDSMLWCMTKTDFLPHLLDTESGAEDTPVLITNYLRNKNNADFLLISNFIDNNEFFEKFEKIFYVFTVSNMTSLELAENSWKKNKKNGYNLKFLRKDDNGKWVESKNFIK